MSEEIERKKRECEKKLSQVEEELAAVRERTARVKRELTMIEYSIKVRVAEYDSVSDHVKKLMIGEELRVLKERVDTTTQSVKSLMASTLILEKTKATLLKLLTLLGSPGPDPGMCKDFVDYHSLDRMIKDAEELRAVEYRVEAEEA